MREGFHEPHKPAHGLRESLRLPRNPAHDVKTRGYRLKTSAREMNTGRDEPNSSPPQPARSSL
jgi:hypothetical protein